VHPHNGLAILISRINRRISVGTAGRPRRRLDLQRSTIGSLHGATGSNDGERVAGLGAFACNLLEQSNGIGRQVTEFVRLKLIGPSRQATDAAADAQALVGGTCFASVVTIL
jgi:hypothetical protein